MELYHCEAFSVISHSIVNKTFCRNWYQIYFLAFSCSCYPLASSMQCFEERSPQYCDYSQKRESRNAITGFTS